MYMHVSVYIYLYPPTPMYPAPTPTQALPQLRDCQSLESVRVTRCGRLTAGDLASTRWFKALAARGVDVYEPSDMEQHIASYGDDDY